MKTPAKEREARLDEMLRTPARNPRYGGAPLEEVIRKAVRLPKPDPIKPPKKPRTPAGA